MVTRQPDGKALVQRDQLPARQRASKLQRREERVPEREFQSVHLLNRRISVRIGLLPIRLFLWDGAPPMSFGTYSESSM